MKREKSFYPTPETISKEWLLVDATDQVLGRLAAQVAFILRGKHKVTFTPSVDMGDHVVVVNADKVRVTGKKLVQKKYYRHSGYPGGLKETSLKDQLKKDSTKVIYDAIKGMLPHNRIGRQMLTKVRVVAGSDNPHKGQNPRHITLAQ